MFPDVARGCQCVERADWTLPDATALMHGLTVVTRNVRDFRSAKVDVLDPFEHDEE